MKLIIFIIFATISLVSPRVLGFQGGRDYHWDSYGNANQQLHRRINTAPIESLILQSPKFDKSTKFHIVLLVISAQYEQKERMEIRRLWAAEEESNMQNTGKSLVIFLVGRSTNLAREAVTYGDLLQINIEETYRNLVYKIEAGFVWLQKHVKSDFVAKIDSDTVVHIDRLHDILRGYEKEQRSNDWIACSGNYWVRPIRDEYNAWYVSQSDYPNTYFPHYCNGPGYAMKRTSFEKIVDRMGDHKVIEVEDVFFTGIVAEGFSFIDRGITTNQYTSSSTCDSNGPILSILNTHHQFGWPKYRKDLAAAWETLKAPYCYESN